MQPLEKRLRNKLERAVEEARETAEAAARAALEQLGVGEVAPFAHLSASDRELRRKLRAYGRQAGDRRLTDKTQEIERLVEEVAYEHWHRMLFVRFLEENNLLMYPDPEAPVPVTLEECEDLAAEEGARNGWELAARFAARMLPQIFRPDSPVFRLTLPPEHQRKLEHLLDELPGEVFSASDSLGWVYQYWQSRRREEVNASGVKIGARELPAVTQLFTESYMVRFLLDNTLGAWWAARRLTDEDLKTAAGEEELRHKASLPGVPLEYLRFVRGEDGRWTPAAGRLDGWPEHLGELKVLDPCCGSGHFLVAAFLMLVPLRMELEGLSARKAVDAVLRDNLHGLEIDRRCVELAAFALAFAAWCYPGAGGYRELPELSLACSGLAVSVPKEEWQKPANSNQRLRIALGLLHDEFQNAPVLGSLLHPQRSAAAKLVEWNELAASVAKALEKERTDEEREAGVVAKGLARAAALLGGRYHWVVTNVPYLARGKQCEILKEFCGNHYKEAKNDLATVFLERCLELCAEGGTTSIVLPQNWLFLTSYKKFREKLLRHDTWRLVARLGPGAFETISGEVVKAILLTLSRGQAGTAGEGLFAVQGENSAHFLRGPDVSEFRTAAEKAKQLRGAEIKSVEQAKQLENPDARISFEKIGGAYHLKDIAHSYHGLTSGDMQRMKIAFWEVIDRTDVWIPYQSTVNQIINFSGNEYLLRWQNGRGAINELIGARKDGMVAWGRKGILVSQMGGLPVTFYNTFAFDNNTAVIIPINPNHLPAIWCFCSSPEYNEAVRRIDQKLNVTNATLVKVPFDLDYWQKVAAEKYPHGLPKPYSDDPTQWIFHGHPCGSVVFNEQTGRLEHGPLRTDATVLQVAVARLLGYRWPAELDPEMELAGEARALVRRCAELLPYADKDGIVCIPPVRGEPAAAERLLNLLAAAYGDAWGTDILSELLKQADHADKTLETWLREKFFTQHCRLFHHRPFIWQIWDGLRDGFSALVNYHRLDRKNLETLVYTYLGDWIARMKRDRESGVDGAGERLVAAENLKKRLELILEGEKPYDIFVRWKPIEKQPIGWAPDLNDGVRLNIRPFMFVPDVAKKGAGVLHDKPNINWNKDRGKDVASAPWHHLFKGERINEHHLSLAEKRAARAAKEGEAE